MGLFIKSGAGSLKSDDELIREFRSTRDSHIISIFFDRYSHLVFAVSMNYLKNEEDSKDATIQIFEKLPSDLLAYYIHNFSSWLHSVTKNYCIRSLSKRRYMVDASEIPDRQDDDDDGFIKELLPLLPEAIRKLNDQQRTCVELFYLQNMSYQEVSNKTGFSMNEVKSFIQNGKRNLKIILQKNKNE